MSCPFHPCVNRRKNNKASGSMSVDSVHPPLRFHFPVLITAHVSEKFFHPFSDKWFNSPFCQRKPSAKRQCHTILYNLLIECNYSFIVIILLIRIVHQTAWPHLNQIKLLAKFSNCIVLSQVVVNCTVLYGTMCGFMIRKLHKIAPLCTHIYVILII